MHCAANRPWRDSEFLKDWLEDLYQAYNCRAYVHPDPLEFLYGYERLQDREVIAFIAASLAYGRALKF